MTGRILLVDDDLAFRRSTGELLREDGHEVVAAADGQEAVEALRSDRFDLILMDLRMPGLDGIRIAEVLRTRGEGAPILMVTGYGTVESAVEALHTGVDDVLTKPVEPEVLSARVRDLLERRPVGGEGPPENPGGMVGRSPAMQEVFAAIRRVAGTDTTVLVVGETGTGKELVARAIHELSERSRGPFVPVNCAALSQGLVESELFGHRKGAFTGAARDREGRFQAADGGTILLDEVADVPPEVQLRLLRVLQEKEVTPVGREHATPVDVRVVAATNRELRGEVEAGRFREDLYYRLNVFRIELPPLRERKADLPLLVEHFLRRRAEKESPSRRPTCSPLAMRILQGYRWPGNVRELFSVLESARIQADGARIEAQDLPPEVREASDRIGNGPERYRHEGSDADERASIRIALEETDGVRSRAAELLGMSRTTLWRKMKAYGLDEEW